VVKSPTAGLRFDSRFAPLQYGEDVAQRNLERLTGKKHATVPPTAVEPPVENVNPWKTIFPGAANYGHFLTIGQCLWSVLMGLVGSLIATRFERGRENTPTASAAP
jgi:hypothetical protein